MDYFAAVERVYEHVENDHVDRAVMACLRIARNLQDFLYTGVFLREMYPTGQEVSRVLCDDMRHLKEEAQKFFFERSLEYWLETRTLDPELSIVKGGEEKRILAIGISEIDHELKQWDRILAELQIPPGMNEYDTVALVKAYERHKEETFLRTKRLTQVKQRVKFRCLNYAIRVERQLQAQSKTQNFLAGIQNDVNNYFVARCENVYSKLQKASQLLDSNDPEDCSLLLTEVRRAIKASADFLFPPSEKVMVCSDGKERPLGDEQYLNRLQEYIVTTFGKSSSGDLLSSELDYLSVFVRRLNEVASKGTHSDVSTTEAKQGLLGLYMFLYNVISRLQEQNS